MRRFWISRFSPRVARLTQVLVTCFLSMCLAIEAGAQSTVEAAEIDTALATPEARIAFRELMAAEDYTAAVKVAERLLELALEEFGTQSEPTAQALSELGDVQRRARLYEDAEVSFLNAIEIFRAIDGPFSPLTIEPSIGLGDTYLDSGQFMNAVAAFNDARTIQRRTSGLLTEDQIPVMDRMTSAFQSMSMHEEADEQQRASLLLVERIYGRADVETLEAIYKYGAWLRSAYRFEQEREQYERALRIIRNEYDKDHPLLVRAYTELGNSWRVQGAASPRGISALNSARELLEEDPTTDPMELAEVVVDIGDWKTAFEPAGSAQEDYLVAWNLLGTSGAGRNARVRIFQPRTAQAVLARGMSIRGLAMTPNESGAVDGHVLVQFDIDSYGRTENIRVIESNPAGFKDEAAARSVRQSRFRPRIEDGQFVTARRQGYRISFRYVPDDEN